MKYGIVHYGNTAYHNPSAAHSTCYIVTELPDGQTITRWKNFLRDHGSDIDMPEPTAADLFQFVKSEYERQKGVCLDIEFSKMYIASVDGTSPIPANGASRLFSEKNEVYVDELILSALFEYIATYYLWAKSEKDPAVSVFCFPYIVGLLNYTCRLGILTNDEQEARLVSQIADCCALWEANLISDLYWSCLAFAFCHEIAHIHLNHAEQPEDSVDVLWQQEYEADAVGYSVYLEMIQTVQEDPKIPFTGIFHDSLYIAPMVLFQFYEDTYFMDYWLFGERAGNSHPSLRSRFEALLQISEQPQYAFETHDGNIILSNYMEISDYFREQLMIKLQKGKLHPIIQEGFAHMSNSGYLEAVRFQKNMCDNLIEDADNLGISSEQLIGLWDTAVDIELLDTPGANAFVWSYKGKTYSSKAFNVRFSLHKVLVSILGFGGSLEVPDTALKAIFAALLILYKIAEISTIELTEDQAIALIECHRLHADTQPIQEDQLLLVSGVSSTTITNLSHIGCIELNHGFVHLQEVIFIR